MILRRIKTHVEKENWFAVGIDFCIVVVGVFVGMQVQAWYLEQDRRVADSQYIERLHGEVVALVTIRQNIVVPRDKNFNDLDIAITKIFGGNPDAALTTEECAAIQISHIYTNPTTEVPTINELLSAGRLDSLSSEPVKNAILRYTQSAARSEDVIESINAGVRVLAREYPELIKLDASQAKDFGLILESPLPSCDLPAMQANQGFLNDLADNKSRFDTYYRFTLVSPTRRLSDLRETLNTELGIAP